MSRFDDQMAIVTGAAEGLGFGVAKRLNGEGQRVTGVDVNSALAHQAPVALARDVCNFQWPLTLPNKVGIGFARYRWTVSSI